MHHKKYLIKGGDLTLTRGNTTKVRFRTKATQLKYNSIQRQCNQSKIRNKGHTTKVQFDPENNVAKEDLGQRHHDQRKTWFRGSMIRRRLGTKAI